MICQAGVITFNNKTCPPLACPEEDRALPVDGCCPICLRRHCGTFLGACAENAHCSNHMMNPRCTCDQGYKGDGVTKCEGMLLGLKNKNVLAYINDGNKHFLLHWLALVID